MRSRIARGVWSIALWVEMIDPPVVGAPAALIYPGSRVTLKVSWSATGRCPSRLQLYLVRTRKVGLYPMLIEASRSLAQ